MNKIISLLIIFLLSFAGVVAAQQKTNYITVVGEKMEGKTINGQSIREVIGHVVLTQGNVRITCEKAIQYLSSNDAELTGNVIAKQDSLTITTEHGFYYGNERRAKSDVPVKLNDKKVILTADSGNYFFDQDKAVFRHNVKMYDTTTTLTSNSLTYFKALNKAVAVGDVKILDKDNIIEADSLIHFRETQISYANRNVKITNLHNHVIIYGNHLEDYPKKSYTLINRNPLFVQIDTSYVRAIDTLASSINIDSTMQIDTLIISAEVMQAWRDTMNLFQATDSVEIVRGAFASKNDFAVYYKNKGKIITKKIKREARQPIIWNSNSQLTGDSISIFLQNNRIQRLEVYRKAFLLSQNNLYKDRFDQMSGSKVIMHFSGGELSQTDVYGGIHSIYYMYEDSTANGLIKSSAQTIKIKFVNRRVNAVKLYGSPTSEFYPENKVAGKELSFTLPQYVFYKNRPTREQLLKKLSLFMSLK